MSCPICQNAVAVLDNPHRPFCSSRCKTIDLARWLGGGYQLPGEPVDPEQLPSETPPRGRS